MENIVITIGREYGSKGREIGEKLAAELGFNFYDKKIIQLAAERSGMTEQILQKADETAGSSFFAPYMAFAVSAITVVSLFGLARSARNLCRVSTPSISGII